MHLLGLGHIGLMIRDIQPALDFYCGKLGFTLATDNRAAGGRGASYFLRNGGVTLELIADPDHPALGGGVIDHISLLVPDLRAAWQELKAQGMAFETEEPLSDPHLYERGEVFIMFRGPSGERLQLEQIL